MTKTFSAPDLDQLYSNWKLAPLLVLPPKPFIIVAGAYQGKLIRLLAEMYPDYRALVGFEPQRWAYEEAQKAIGGLGQAVVMNRGLLAGPGHRRMAMGEFGTDACSVLATTRVQGEGNFVDAKIALRSWLPCDLFVMNMEGYEYQLLPYFMLCGIMEDIGQIAVQFHTQYAPADGGANLLSVMDKAYTRTVDQYPSWVYWTKPTVEETSDAS